MCIILLDEHGGSCVVVVGCGAVRGPVRMARASDVGHEGEIGVRGLGLIDD